MFPTQTILLKLTNYIVKCSQETARKTQHPW